MNAPRHEPHARPKPTHTFWPTRRPPTPPPSPRTTDTRDDRADDDRAGDEPGYGHGV